ncbi:DUF397 domain-containing protein [Embleya sp. AB8]|uniref:DUF397 domain-containing protein n=1 Tax=Embleya sp. AB8 TaxID=3156304 RepID=UPI003C738C9B
MITFNPVARARPVERAGHTGDVMDARKRWTASTHSGGENCVEVAVLGATVGVRDSKVADSPVITLDPAAWVRLIERAAR